MQGVNKMKMKKNLPIVQQDSKVMLSKTKSLMRITKKILGNKLVLSDDGWMQRLWDWADANDISNDDLARDREELLASIGLILSNNNLTRLPKEIGNLTNLTWLVLSNNNLTELPKEIGNLTNLTELVLWDNNLTELPKEIGDLTNLIWLELWDNNLTELPKEIGNLTNLTKLDLHRNNLTELSKEIGDLTNLTKLDLHGNNLTELPKEIENLTNLTWLELYSNNLTELPKEIGNLTNLTELYLGYNNLTELPKEIGDLTNLTELVLRDNNITKLPKEIGNLTNLTELGLSSNNLTELPKEIRNLTNLTKLDLWDNANLILTNTQKEWINDLKSNDCDVDMDDNLFNRGTLSINRHQKTFDQLVKKLYDRDYDLGSCFERNITFVSFENNKLTWSSDAKDDDKKILITHWGLINMFVKDTFGFEVKIVNIANKNKLLSE